MRTSRFSTPVRFAAISAACLLAATLTAGRLDAQRGHPGRRPGHGTVRPPAGGVKERFGVRAGTHRRPRERSPGHRGRRTSVVIVPYGYPYYYPYYPYGGYAPYSGYVASSPYYPRSVLRAPGEPESRIIAADSNLVVELIGTSVVRLTWPDAGRAAGTVGEVRLFLADGDEQVLAMQAVRAGPFTALFDASAYAAYAGVTVVYIDGRRSTTLLPLQTPR
jgi:hypothetical protein